MTKTDQKPSAKLVISFGEMVYPKIWSTVDARTEFYSKEVKRAKTTTTTQGY